jgi:hypothetical protein
LIDVGFEPWAGFSHDTHLHIRTFICIVVHYNLDEWLGDEMARIQGRSMRTGRGIFGLFTLLNLMVLVLDRGISEEWASKFGFDP